MLKIYKIMEQSFILPTSITILITDFNKSVTTTQKQNSAETKIFGLDSNLH